MDNLTLFYVIVGLFFVIGAEFIFLMVVLDRESKEKAILVEQNAKLQAALIAKSANEYTMMRTMDKVIKEEPKQEPGAVDMSELNDEEYDKMIKQQLQTGTV